MQIYKVQGIRKNGRMFKYLVEAAGSVIAYSKVVQHLAKIGASFDGIAVMNANELDLKNARIIFKA